MTSSKWRCVPNLATSDITRIMILARAIYLYKVFLILISDHLRMSSNIVHHTHSNDLIVLWSLLPFLSCCKAVVVINSESHKTA